MFTGIVEEMGTVLSMQEVEDLTLWDGSKGKGFMLVVECKVCLDGCYLGASIAVNGTCLTATEFTESQVSFGVAPETLRLTNLGQLKPGSSVNMERAAKMGDRNSGHYVQGHVDGTGEIVEKRQEADSLWITLKTTPEIMASVVHKGFIAIDGASLTVCEVDYTANTFDFMLVQYTQQKIIIPHKQVGDYVNLEIDVLGKYASQVTGKVAAMEQRFTAFQESVESRLDRIEALLLAKQ